MSGPDPARYGPDPENISPVRVRVPLTLEWKLQTSGGSFRSSYRGCSRGTLGLHLDSILSLFKCAEAHFRLKSRAQWIKTKFRMEL